MVIDPFNDARIERAMLLNDNEISPIKEALTNTYRRMPRLCYGLCGHWFGHRFGRR